MKRPFDFDVSAFAELPKARGIFVTGTDTEVGKTLIAGAIARRLRRQGRSVEVFKPVATGCRRTREGLVSADAEFLAACADSRSTLREINPVRYAAPLAPNVAAERARRDVDLDAIFQAYRRLTELSECVVVEGIGGLLCPITNDFWVIHLARLLDLPVVIVARSGLGTINHTLLTLHAARCADLEVAGVVMNRYRIDPHAARGPGPKDSPNAREPRGKPESARGPADLAMMTNPAQIAQRGQVKVLALAPDDPASSVEKATIGPDTQFAIDQVDWASVAGMD